MAQAMSQTPRVTLVTEAYNLAEGQSEAAFVRALDAVSRIADRRGDVEVIILDPSEDNAAERILERTFPAFRSVHAKGMTYDGQKNLAAEQGRGEFLVFLDGDCAPAYDDWLEQMISPMEADPDMAAVAGVTIYDDFSLTGQAMSILDFGFLFDVGAGEEIGCYASNNVAFRREAYVAHPAPDDGVLRCYCYRHAQEMLRAGTPVRLNPRAVALHELPDIQTERLRRGWDHVAALWEDPALPAASDIACNLGFARSILETNFKLALTRLERAAPLLRIDLSRRKDLVKEIQRLMQMDGEGVVSALKAGDADGRNRKALAANRAVRANGLTETSSAGRS
jgi:hypothetical protein